MPERHARGLIDTSVVFLLDELSPQSLPHELAISAITLAELAAGPEATSDSAERVRRQVQYERVHAAFITLAFDQQAAHAYGGIVRAVVARGRKPRGRRAMDLLIAATALANELPLYTRNVRDFDDLREIVDVVRV